MTSSQKDNGTLGAFLRLFLLLLAGVFAGPAAFGETCLGAQGFILLPPGGSSHAPRGGALVSAGLSLSESWMVEARVGALEQGALLGCEGIFRWTGFELYDRFFGFSPFDPFFSVGAMGTFASDDGLAGPSCGAGAFYHLTENWSLRAEATALLNVNAACDVHFLLSCGFSSSF